MAKKSAKKEELSREQLVILAKEMNSVMGLEPAISVKKSVSDEDLLENILSEATGQVYQTDFEEDPEDDEKEIFSDEAADMFKVLGVEVVASDEVPSDEEDDETEEEEEVVEEKPKKGKKASKVEEEEVEEKPKKGAKGKKVVEEPEEVEEEEEKPKKDKKAPVKEEKKSSKGKGKPVPEEDEEEEKPAKGAKAKTAKQVEREKSNADKKERLADKKGKTKGAGKYSRALSIADAIKNGKSMTYDELRIASGKLYCEKNGSTFDPEYTNWYMEYSFPIMEALGYITKDKKDKLVFHLPE